MFCLSVLGAGCGGGGGDTTAAETSEPVTTATAAGAPSGTPALSEGNGGTGGTTGTGGSGEPGGATGEIIDALNAARGSPRECGATRYPAALPLAIAPDAEEAADAHTSWMQSNRTMSHTGANGSSVGTRLSSTGYRWSAVGENVAMGQASPAAVVAAWLASPGHCANIMNATFVDVGFAFAPRAAGASTYATLVLARPR